MTLETAAALGVAAGVVTGDGPDEDVLPPHAPASIAIASVARTGFLPVIEPSA
jgi:hypothetical protein